MEKTRQLVYLQVNHQVYQFSGSDLLLNLATFLRDRLQLTATKIACNEGDCGACTVLVGRPCKSSDNKYSMNYQLMNSCIMPLFTLDAAHIITLEGLHQESLSFIQQAMLEQGAAQCGYCTPGMVMSLVDLFQHRHLIQDKDTGHSIETIKEKLKGNLCRCTGYQPIINAALSAADKQQQINYSQDYAPAELAKKLWHKQQEAVSYNPQGSLFSLWIANTLEQALRIKQQYTNSQICAGCSDLAPLWNKKRAQHQHYLSLYKISSLAEITETDKTLHIGAQVSLQQIEEHLAAHNHPGFKAFVQLLQRFASPQIKNRATLTGNIANGSPVADTIPFLMVSKAKVECQQPGQQRLVKMAEFYQGYKQLALANNEIISGIILPKFKQHQQCFLYKVSQRYDIDISCVSAAFLIELSSDNKIQQIRIAFGGIAATVVRLYDAEQLMRDQQLTEELIEQAIAVALSTIKPLSDIRGSDLFRKKLLANLFRKFYFELISDALIV